MSATPQPPADSMAVMSSQPQHLPINVGQMTYLIILDVPCPLLPDPFPSPSVFTITWGVSPIQKRQQDFNYQVVPVELGQSLTWDGI